MAGMTNTQSSVSAEDQQWDLCLYVTGKTPRALRAVTNLKRICEKHLAGRYRIEVVDLLEDPQRAFSDQIVAIPTVVRKLPLPVRRSIGDLSNAKRVLAALDFSET